MKHIRHCLRIAEAFEESAIVYAVRRQLSWTHLRTISYETEWAIAARGIAGGIGVMNGARNVRETLRVPQTYPLSIFMILILK